MNQSVRIRRAARRRLPRRIAPAAAASRELEQRPRLEAGGRDVVTRRVLAAVDLTAIAAAICVSQLVVTPGHSAGENCLLSLITLPAWVALFKLYGLYDRDSKRISHSTLEDIPQLFHALVVGSLALWAYSKLLLPERLQLAQGVAFFAVSMAGVLAGRAAARGSLIPRIAQERAILVGGGPSARVIARKIRSHPEYCLELVDCLGAEGREPGVIECLSRLEDMQRGRMPGSGRAPVDRVVLVTADVDRRALLELIRRCSDLGIKISLVPNLVEVIGSAVEVDDLEGVTLFGINPPALTRSSRSVKRALDVAVASTALVLALPVMLVAALAIKITSRGPIFYAQERVGRRGRRFRILKFRTMFPDADERAEELRKHSAHPAWLLLDHDPRITRAGRILRRVSVDELPQLLNVLRGDMSLVGPRPMTPDVDKMIDGWGRRRLDLTPGITGLWQVLGRTSIPFEEMVSLDYLYVTNWSLWQDVRLLIRTLPTVTAGRGAN